MKKLPKLTASIKKAITDAWYETILEMAQEIKKKRAKKK